MSATERTHWILTRDASDLLDDLDKLTRRGVDASAVPCIECTDLPWPAWTASDATPVYFLTSRRAARRFLESGDAASGALIAAVAPTTAATLEAGGVRVDVRATGGAKGLADALLLAWESRNRPSWAIRYPTSDAGAGTSEQAAALDDLQRIGAVERKQAYVTGVPAGLAASLAEHARGTWAVSFLSPSAVSAFLANVPREAPAPRAVLCFGNSTANEWNDARPPAWPRSLLCTSNIETILELEEVP